jgi:methionyl-tRNA formyltransferase
MKDIRIVFMGTPEFAVGILETLLKNHYKVVGVITAPDKPAGRGRKLHQSAVKKFALTHDLPLLQPTNLKDKVFLDELKALRANLQIVVAFRMLPKVVWEMPAYGTFNLHASLLPQYRGAAPINWAIINGEEKTGVTTFFIDDAIDTGAIILQREIAIYEDDTAGSLHDRLMVLGAAAVLETVRAIEKGTVNTKVQQDNGTLKTAHKIHKDTCRIAWNQPLEDVHNFIRGLSPYPTAWTMLHNGDEEIHVKVYSAVKEPGTPTEKPGTLVIGKKSMKVAVQDGFLQLLEVQLQGKRRMAVSDVLNGLHPDENAYMS